MTQVGHADTWKVFLEKLVQGSEKVSCFQAHENPTHARLLLERIADFAELGELLLYA